MTALEATTLHFAGHGGDDVRAERFAPASTPAGETRTGIVLAHEVFGLDAAARLAARRLVDAGHVVLVPDLYSREGVPGPASTTDDPAPAWAVEQIRAAAAGLPDRRAVGDLEAAARVLAEDPEVDPDRIAAVGFCMGGKLALLLGCQSRRLAGVVDFYGSVRYAELGPARPVQPLEMTLNLSSPLLAVFGEKDESIPLADVEELREKLAAFAKPAEIVVEPGVGHGFLNPLRSSWNEDAAERTWARARAFLDEVLAP